MEIGAVIRKYRKEKEMTQEEMAGCLGVTASAVNKWENGNTLPDVALLAPVARLLGITTDTLLSFILQRKAYRAGNFGNRRRASPVREREGAGSSFCIF